MYEQIDIIGTHNGAIPYAKDVLAAVFAGLFAWVLTLQRRLHAARMRGDMYRDISARLDQQVVELSAREH